MLDLRVSSCFLDREAGVCGKQQNYYEEAVCPMAGAGACCKHALSMSVAQQSTPPVSLASCGCMQGGRDSLRSMKVHKSKLEQAKEDAATLG